MIEGDTLNQKAFTLIELIAVIFIIAMLFLLASPPVVNLVKNNEQDLYDQQITTIKLGAENWLTDNLDQRSNNQIVLTLRQLKDGGYIDENIKNPTTGVEFSDSSTVTITL